jgi:hypothetical protein
VQRKERKGGKVKEGGQLEGRARKEAVGRGRGRRKIYGEVKVERDQ